MQISSVIENQKKIHSKTLDQNFGAAGRKVLEIPAACSAAVAVFALVGMVGRWYRPGAGGAAAAPIAAAGGRGIAAASRRRRAIVPGGAASFQAIPVGGAGGTTGRGGGTGGTAGRGLGVGGAAGRTRLGLALRLGFGFGLGAGLLLAAGAGLGLLLVRRAVRATGVVVLRQESTNKRLLFRGRCGFLGGWKASWAAGLLLLLRGCGAAATGRGIRRCCCRCRGGCRRAGRTLRGGTAVAASGSLGLLHGRHLSGNGWFRLLVNCG